MKTTAKEYYWENGTEQEAEDQGSCANPYKSPVVRWELQSQPACLLFPNYYFPNGIKGPPSTCPFTNPLVL